jgi:hypothetical protein
MKRKEEVSAVTKNPREDFFYLLSPTSPLSQFLVYSLSIPFQKGFSF